MWDVLNQNWVGALIGLIGLGVAIYFYRTSKSVPKPAYQSQAFRILRRDEDNLPEDVSIRFKRTAVDRLTRTTIIFWNDGDKVLNGSDIVKDDPLLVSYPEGSKILSFALRKQTKDVHKFRLTRVPNESNKLSINFDYLDPKGGSAYEIIHDSENLHPEILGSIKGIPSGFKAVGTARGSYPPSSLLLPSFLRRRPASFRATLTLFLWMAFTVGILMVGFGMSMELLDVRSSDAELKIIAIIVGITYTSMAASLLWLTRRRYPKHLDIGD